MPTLLQQLESAGCLVDVDSFVPAVAKSLPLRAHDATSNQALIGLCVYAPENAQLVNETIKNAPDASALDILTTLHAKFGKIQLANIDGRVLAQTSPSFPHDKEKIIAHARAYAKAFESEGVSKDRFAIKIPTTSAGMQAAAALKEEGIASLGTVLFSVPQAIAASQAGIYAISPYFNPCRGHVDEAYWIDSADPARDHPMAHRMRHIRDTYDRLAKETGKPQPQIKGAGYVTAREVMAQLDLGCNHVTVLPASLADLIAYDKLPPHRSGEWSERWVSRVDEPNLDWKEWNIPKPDHSEVLARLATSDPFDKQAGNFTIASTDVDYLADGVLDSFNERDEATKFRLADALETFKTAEDKLLAYIDDLRAGLTKTAS